MYYISQIMLGLETMYSYAEQTILALVMVAKKLRPYFQAHIIIVLTKQPQRLILMKRNISRRMVRWSTELSEFDLKYMPKTIIKAQALTNFIIEEIEDEQGAKQEVNDQYEWVI